MTQATRPMIEDEHFVTLNRYIPNEEDYALAERHAPILRFDVKEPFFPLAAGYTVFREDDKSPSFPRQITLKDRATAVIEYAIWWDWDIGHLYELEHVWVYINNADEVVAVDASWHGGWNAMQTEAGSPPLHDGRAIVYSEPGKHAFAATIGPMLERKKETVPNCGPGAGTGGVWITPLFEGVIHNRNRENNRIVRSYLQRRRFEPTYEFSNLFDVRAAALVPWDALNTWIPQRVDWWCRALETAIPYSQRHVLAIAHRGASAYAQESSPEAIRKAAEIGADMVEVDVRFTADNVPVIAHDSDLQRVFGVPGNISEMTIDAVKAATPAGKAPVQTFAELVKLCREVRIGLYLDIKAVNMEGMVTMTEALREHGMFKYAIFGSFRPDWVAEIKANIPDAQTSVLFSSAHVEPVSLALSVGADYVHPCWERFDCPQDYLTPEWLAAVRAQELGIICWHEERPSVIAALKALGVDGICSDMPDLLVD